jgi:4-hydroxy-tetrahydrodipicolinate reductase
MKIAIIGYGKMGHAVEKIAKDRGHEIVAIIDADNQADFGGPQFASAQVAIEFSAPSAALDNYRRCWAQGVPVVSGTTGWVTPDALQELGKEAAQKGTSLLHASNFSIGVNLFMAVNSYLARIIGDFPQYTASIHEIHHTQKLDHPSGTAITLAQEIIEANKAYKSWAEPEASAPAPDVLPISHERIGANPGFHQISWKSPVDTITLTHQANSREGFALGAVIAAEWLASQPAGHIYSIHDMLKF